MGQKLLLISISSVLCGLISLVSESVILALCIILIASVFCCADAPVPEIPKPKPWGPTISAKEAKPFIEQECPFCGTLHMVSSPEHRPKGPHLIKCNKCGEVFSIK